MHSDDHYPYRSRDQLFETIRQQRIEIDNLHERIRAFEAQFEPIDMPSQLDPARRAYLNGSERDDLDEFAERLPA